MTGKTLEDAKEYVGSMGENYYTVGKLQLELLKQNGCLPNHNVLEVGCGCLVAGNPIIDYLAPSRYIGIEPNEWLTRAAQKQWEPAKWDKKPQFYATENFELPHLDGWFDYVISHSVLSHAAYWQLPQFVNNIGKYLANDGVILASIRFTDEGYGILGDSNHYTWQYPGCSYFSWPTVQRVCTELGYRVEWRRDYREFFVKEAPTNFHDWIRITKGENAKT